MRAAVAIIVLGACGRVGFDSLGDAKGAAVIDARDGAVDAATHFATPVVVETSAQNSTGNGLGTGFLSTVDAGDLIIVGVGSFGGPTAVTGVTDSGGNTYVNSNVTSTSTSGDCEIWYSVASFTTTTLTVSVVWATNTNTEIWAVVVRNMDPAPFDVGNVDNNDTISAIVAAPTVTPTTPTSFIFSLLDGSGTVEGLRPSAPPFVPMVIQVGDDAAYTTAIAPGTYGAAWDDESSGTFNASTAAFKPAVVPEGS